jgi:hypothetical protein
MKIENLGSWQRTRNVLVSTLMVLNEAQGAVEFSELPESEFMKLERELRRASANISAHSVYALKLINEAINQSGLIDRIETAAKDAKKEADRIKNATKKIDEITRLVDTGTEIVGFFSNLAVF